MNLNSTFKLFTTNVLVSGAIRSMVVDTHRQNLHFIPNSMYQLLLEHGGKQTLLEIIEIYGEEARETLLEYFEFLLNKEIIFLTDQPHLFPDMDLSWDYPSHITNAILEFNPDLSDHYQEIIQELDELLCNYVEIRLFKSFTKNDLDLLLSAFENTTVLAIHLLMNSPSDFQENYFEELIKANPRIATISVYNTSLKKKETTNDKLTFHEHEINSHCCGQISKAYFTPNMKGVTEALEFNSCLNRKVAVDVDGNIKNCPSMSKGYGNIKNTSILDVSRQEDFQKIWSINKNKIHVCKDCEFRYVCTDCRAFIEDPEDIYSKPLKCGYNPYTGKWSEWSDNPLKEKAIAYYGLEKLTTSLKEEITQ